MMHFVNADDDGGLLAELKDAEVLDPGSMEQIHELMGHPESGSLTEFLLAGANVIPVNPWLYWLIRRHGCHRFGRVSLHAEEAGDGRAQAPMDANLPYRRTPGGALLVAVLRPDLMAATAKRLAPNRALWAAGTLPEIRDLREAWLRAGSGAVGASPR
jgi:hypothetical protein